MHCNPRRSLLPLRSLVLILIGLTALSTPLALAGSTKSTEGSDDSVLYETATVRARPVAEATASVTVLGRTEIEALNVASAAELMRFIPGLDVVPNGPRGGLAWVQVRGGEPNFTAVLVDGVPLNDPTDQFGGVVNLNGLSTMHIERVEVVRGPLSFFNGASGLSGAVNIITRRGGRSGPSVGFQVGAGDASLLEGGVSFGGGNEDHSFYVGASWEEEEERIADDAFEKLELNGSFELGPEERPTLRISGRAASWEGTDYADASGGPVFGDGATRFSEHDEISLGVDWTLGSEERPHRVRVAYYRHDLDRVSPRIDENPPDPFSFVPFTIEETEFDNIEVGWSYTALSAGLRRLDVGVGVDHETGENRGIQDFTNDFPFFSIIPTDYELDRTTGSAFVQFSDRRGNLDIDLGLRIDVPDEFDTEISPKVGLGYRLPNGSTRLRFSASRSYKLPSFFALASAIAGNPDLDPEVAWGGDVAVEQSLASGRVTGSLGVFFYRYEDLIDFDFDAFMNVNRDDAKSKGAEFSLRWRASDAVTVDATVTYQDVEILDSPIELRHRPEWVGSARLTWSATDRIRLGLDGQTVAERFDEQLPVGKRPVDGYEIFGASASFEIGSNWEVHARIDNLLDDDYDTFIGFPGAERSYRAGVRFRTR